MQVQLEEKKGFSAQSVGRVLRDNLIILGILLIAIIVGILRPNFFSLANFRNLISNTAVRFIIALGVSGCLITKGTDLSAGRVAGLAACISAILLQKGDYSQKFYPNLGEIPIWSVLLIVMAVCAIVGAVNGSVISFFKVPPFIATLGMQTLVYGICLVYTGASPIGGLRRDYTQIATSALDPMISYIVLGLVGLGIIAWAVTSGRKRGIGFMIGVLAIVALLGWAALSMQTAVFSYIACIAFAVGGLMWFLYNKTRHGKYMYAIGGNENAAEVAGVNTSKTKIKIYMLAAMLYGLCGFLIASKAGGASVNTAQGYELEAIAGCTIGGVSVNGGVGKISSILIGVLVFELLKIAMQFMGIETSYTYIVQGLVIIVAVALDLRKYLAKK